MTVNTPGLEPVTLRTLLSEHITSTCLSSYCFLQGHLSVYVSSSGVIWGHLKILNFRASAKASFRNKMPSQVLGCISGGTTEDFPPIQPNLYVIFIILWVKSALIFAMKIFQISILHGTSLNYNFFEDSCQGRD